MFFNFKFLDFYINNNGNIMVGFVNKFPSFDQFQYGEVQYDEAQYDEGGYYDEGEYIGLPIDEDYEGAVLTEAVPLNLLSPIAKKGEPDAIEKFTLQIFARLYEIADRKVREEIESFVQPIACEPISPKKQSRSYSTHYYESGTNLLDEEFGFPVHTPNVVQNMIASFTELFFGWRSTDDKNQKNNYQMKDVFILAGKEWNYVKNHYSKEFRTKMESVLKTADELLTERMKDADLAFVCRIAFYAGLVITAVGYSLNQKVSTCVGLVCSVAAFGFMISHFLDFSFRQMQHESALKTNVENCYFEVSKHRS